MYVSSVAYGRLAYLTVESTADLTTIEANLNAALDMTKASGEASVAAALSFFSTETSTNITVIGGSVVALDLGSFRGMLENDTFSEENAGAIIAYQLRFVHDNSVATTVFNGEYTGRHVEMMEGDGVDVELRVTQIQTDLSDGLGSSIAELSGNVYFETFDTGVGKCSLWYYTTGTPYECTVSGTTPFSGTSQTITFPATSSRATISIEDFREVDPSPNPDDPYTVENPPPTYYVSDFIAMEGDTFTVTARDNAHTNQYVRFTILVVDVEDPPY